MARITPASSTMMELERFWIILKMLPFYPCGVWPTCVAMSATCWFTLSNIPVKFPMMPPTSISFSQLVRASNKKSIRCQTSFQPLPLCAGGDEDFSGVRSDGEQAGQQRYEDHANDGDARAGHQLFHALAFRTGVVVAVTFQQVDDTPDAETSAQSDNEGLKNGDSLIEKCHKL